MISLDASDTALVDPDWTPFGRCSEHHENSDAIFTFDLENSFEAGKTFSSQTLQPKQQQAALTSLALSANDGASVSEDWGLRRAAALKPLAVAYTS
jgi:hypothetical protein